MEDIPLITKDPWLGPYAEVIRGRKDLWKRKERELVDESGKLIDFANGHQYFGLHRNNRGWITREWAPNASEIFLICDKNAWKPRPSYAFTQKEAGQWELQLEPDQLKHQDLFKLYLRWPGGEGERIPAWHRRVVQDPESLVFNAQAWDPPEPYRWKHQVPDLKKMPPLIYEAHVGMSTEEPGINSYDAFRRDVLPWIKRAGYNTVQLMALQEHPYYGSFGYHVSSFFAASSRFGTPEELKALIDEAHGLGLRVIMDLVHSHAVKNEVEGLGKYDGTPYQFFHEGTRGEHLAWDSLCFNYDKNEVLHFLLSNAKYWLEEYRLDGFRFDGVTSMLYLNHGLNIDFISYDMYFDGTQDEAAIVYLSLVNKLIKEVHPGSITIAEEMSAMPGLAAPLEEGGMGFGYRMAMGIPDYWIRIIKELPDEHWDVEHIYYELSRHRNEEKTVSYAESHDQALVGDKTIIFRLIDKDMYDYMAKNTESLTVDRGIALHKMIRLVTLATAGGAYLNFMGNEFGHPEWIDFPREGNNWSYHYARRQWSLAQRDDLKYHYLSDFDRDMIHVIEEHKILSHPWPWLITANRGDQVLAFKRGSLIFVFNFSPTTSYNDYGIPVKGGKCRIVLDSDAPAYGGQGRVDNQMTYYPVASGKVTDTFYLKIYLPARCALVFHQAPGKRVY